MKTYTINIVLESDQEDESDIEIAAEGTIEEIIFALARAVGSAEKLRTKKTA